MFIETHRIGVGCIDGVEMTPPSPKEKGEREGKRNAHIFFFVKVWRIVSKIKFTYIIYVYINKSSGLCIK